MLHARPLSSSPSLTPAGAFTLHQWFRRSAFSALVFFTAMFTASFAHAQFRTSVQGVVTDPTGAVIPGATLTLKNNATNETVVRTSNGDGVFNFNALPSDAFTLTVVRQGFQKKVLADLQFIPEQANSLNVQLALAGTTQVVTVNASTVSAMDTETANIGGTISSNEIQHLPTSNRDPFTLAQLVPGEIDDGSQGSGGGVYSLPGNAGDAGSGSSGQMPTENKTQAFANGQQNSSNSISIDGISTVSAVWGGASVITPDLDSVQNMRVVTNDYDAEEGRFSGAQMEITSKSGTNQLHGSAFIQIHRPGLNAFQRGTPNTSPVKNEADFNQYGGSLGGPLLKDRLFAFFAFESSPDSSNVKGDAWYDTPAFDALAPANSIAAQYLSYPGAGVSSASLVTSAINCAAAGLVQGVNCNAIAGAGLNIGSPLTTPLGTQDPTEGGTPADPGVGSGLSNVADIAEYVVNNPTTTYYRDFNGRLDADVTKKDHLAFAIYWVPQGTTDYNGGNRPYQLFHHQQINDAFTVIYNHTFSPNFLNEARANASGWRWNEIASNPQSPVGFPTDTIDTIGSVTIGQFGPSLGSIYNQWTYSYNDVATKIVGEQTIKFGGEFTHLQYLDDPIGRPSYSFYNVWDFLNDAPQSESGNFDTATGYPGGVRQDYRENLFGFFVQDNYRVRPNLTIFAGLRYSYFGSLYDKQNNTSVALYGSGTSLLTGLHIREGGNLWTPQKLNFGPQIGFNWSPSMFNNKMVVRGGYGLNYNQEEIAISSNVGANPPAQGYYDFTYSNPTTPGSGANILYALSSSPTSYLGFPANPNTITGYNSAGLPTAGNAYVATFGLPDNKLPTAYTEHYSLNVDYEIGRELVASLGYQGSVSHHQIVQENQNAAALAGGFGINPLIDNLDLYGNEGPSNNNEFLAELKHPFVHHFNLDAQFFWAKSMDEASTPYEEEDYTPDRPSLDYGRSDYNIGKSFKLYGLWQPVFFHKGNNWAEKIAGGWSLSGIFNLHTGFPWTPNYALPDSLYCSSCSYDNVRPQYLGGGGTSHSNHAFEYGTNFPNYTAVVAAQNQPTGTVNGATGIPIAYSNQYFNVPNFASAISYPGSGFPAVNDALPPPPGMARNSFTGPGYRDVDASLAKAFGLPNTRLLGDNANFEIRADFLNLFNLLNLNPGSVNSNINVANFGEDYTPLGSRTISFEGRFSF